MVLIAGFISLIVRAMEVKASEQVIVTASVGGDDDDDDGDMVVGLDNGGGGDDGIKRMDNTDIVDMSNGTKTSTTTALPTALIHELGLHNFDTVIRHATFTFVLFYDPYEKDDEGDTSGTRQAADGYHAKRRVLEALATSVTKAMSSSSNNMPWFLRSSNTTQQISIRFATLDIRRHNYLRHIYLRWPGAATSEAYQARIQNWDADLPHMPIPPFHPT